MSRTACISRRNAQGWRYPDRDHAGPARPLSTPSGIILDVRRPGAANRIRTCDPVITNDVLYQLSYCGGPCGAFSNTLKTPAPDIGHATILQEKRGHTTGKKRLAGGKIWLLARKRLLSRPSGTGSRPSRRPDPAAD